MRSAFLLFLPALAACGGTEPGGLDTSGRNLVINEPFDAATGLELGDNRVESGRLIVENQASCSSSARLAIPPSSATDPYSALDFEIEVAELAVPSMGLGRVWVELLGTRYAIATLAVSAGARITLHTGASPSATIDGRDVSAELLGGGGEPAFKTEPVFDSTDHIRFVADGCAPDGKHSVKLVIETLRAATIP